MKKILLGTVALIALGAIARASAADLAARTYTKAPAPMVAAVYDWSGFYVGLNGGGGSSRKCWTNTSTFGVATVPNSPKAATTRPAAWPAVRSVIAGRPRTGCSAWKPRATGPTSRARNASLLHARCTDQTKIDAFGLFTGQVGYAWNNVLWYVKGGAAVTDDKYNGITTATGVAFDRGQRDPLGRHGRHRRRIRLRAELVGRGRIRPSVHGQRTPSPSPVAPALSPAPTTSVRTSTWPRCASTTAGAARWSRSTESRPRAERSANSEKAGLAPAFLFACRSGCLPAAAMRADLRRDNPASTNKPLMA